MGKVKVPPDYTLETVKLVGRKKAKTPTVHKKTVKLVGRKKAKTPTKGKK